VTVGGCGYAPVAPGTVGSAVALVVLWLVPLSIPARVALVLVTTVAGIVGSGRVERVTGTKDPGIIVIDEVAGMIMSVLWLPQSPAVLIAAFVLFRVFDVVKPPPASWSQALPGGLGVMLDDLIAGVYTLAILAATRASLGGPG
jgi:phosphatidylglycerophosphatase A